MPKTGNILPLTLILLIGGLLLVAGPTPALSEIDDIDNRIELPQPESIPAELGDVLALRRSRRKFDRLRPLTLKEISQLFWAAQGISDSRGCRTAPSAGALYPLRIYAVTQTAIYEYQPQGHKAYAVEREGLLDSLRACIGHGGRYMFSEAPAVFIITGDVRITAQKYGERSERYLLLEVGHAAQNLLLQAEAMKLNACPVGAFREQRVSSALDLPYKQIPYYLIPVGWEPEHPVN